jgi:GT2 family glycosyltransferase
LVAGTGADAAVPSIGRAHAAIVVVSFGAHELLADSLTAIGHDPEQVRIVVVDNYHSTTERAAITALAQEHGWDLRPMPTNLGFGAAVNIGVDAAFAAGCDAVVVLNPDATVAATTVEALAEVVRREPMTMVAPRIVRPDGRVWFKGGRLDLRTGEAARPGGRGDAHFWITGACFAISSTLWAASGGFDDDYFLYWEDLDLSWRCLRAGGELVVRNDLQAVHSVGGTQDPTGKSSVYYYYNCRNRLLFAAKHLPRRALAGWLLRTPGASWRILLRGGGKRGLARSPKLLWAGVRGTFAGARVAVAALISGGGEGGLAQRRSAAPTPDDSPAPSERVASW